MHMLFHCPSSFRSPTFRAILTADTSGRIEMKKTSLKTGQDLVHYIYNRQLRNGSEGRVCPKVGRHDK
jgi:hypothetical protein